MKVAFIGAGGINFGSPEGPWNHSARLQLLPDVTFSAIVDPNQKLAQQRIDTLQNGMPEASEIRFDTVLHFLIDDILPP